MKKSIILITLCLLILTSCKELICPDVPPPEGTPDETSTYTGDDGYKSVTYTYYCWNGKYRAITWTRTVKCGSWHKSEYTSDCIKRKSFIIDENLKNQLEINESQKETPKKQGQDQSKP